MKFFSRILVLCCLWSTLCCTTTSAHAGTITVQNTNDSGPGSLRQAVADAVDGDTINFDPSVTGTITLTSEPITINTHTSEKAFNIVGPGAAKLTLSGNNERVVFRFLGRLSPISISGLTIANCLAETWTHAAIYTQNPLTVSDCVFRDNRSDYGEGGAIAAIITTLTVRRCSFSNNYSFSNGGAIYFNQGVLTLDQCNFTGNTAGYYGGAVFSLHNSLSITNCTFDNNNCPRGGAVYCAQRSPSAYGFPTGPSSISYSSFTRNTAPINSTDSFQVGVGGALTGSTINLNHCTFSDNRAEGSQGGAIAAYNATINNCTITGNSAPSGSGGGLSAPTDFPNNTTVYGSIIAGNTAVSGPDISGSIVSQNYNLIQNISHVTISGNTTHDKYGVDPLLGPLQNNGGPTLTRALLAGSPAIDAGDPATSAATDQRGLPRVKDGDGNGSARADIGAFEVQNTLAVGGRVSTANGIGVVGAAVTLGGLTVQSNSAGYYSFAAVPPGSYTVRPAYQNFSFEPAYRVVSVTTSSISGLNFVGGHSISGRIYNVSGVGLSNVKVTRSGAPSGSSATAVYTNSAGYYTFATLIPGVYTITPSHTGFSFSPPSRSVEATNGSVSGQNFVASSGYSVSGRVATSAGVAVAGVTVTIVESGATASTNSAGYYTFNNIPNGSYTLAPSKSGMMFSPNTKIVTINGANASGYNFTGAAS